MHIITLGCNHNTASLELIESLNISSFKLNQELAILKSYPYITGCVILSTCNRTEIYVSSRNSQSALESIIEFLKNSKNVCLENHRDSFYVFNTKDSIRHIFRVASGLDSMVVGETQILGQVKNAYRIASREKTTSKILNMIFQKSFNIAKKIRHNSRIGRLPVSVSSVALKLLIKNFKSLDNKKVLIIGSGKISELTARGLLKNNVGEIFVANRTFSSARSLARIFNARCIKFFEIIEYLRDIDILISCTSAPHLIIKREDVSDIIAERRKRLFILDLAMPRDIDPSLGDNKNIRLYNIDSLKLISQKNLRSRKKELALCDSIIEDEVFSFSKKLPQASLDLIHA